MIEESTLNVLAAQYNFTVLATVNELDVVVIEDAEGDRWALDTKWLAKLYYMHHNDTWPSQHYFRVNAYTMYDTTMLKNIAAATMLGWMTHPTTGEQIHW